MKKNFFYFVANKSLKITYLLTMKNKKSQIKACARVSENTGNSMENFPTKFGSSKYHAFGIQLVDTFV